MGILDLQFKCTLENVTELQLPMEAEWHFKTRCVGCGEVSQEVYFNMVELQDIEGSRGQAHYIAKRGFCEKRGNVVFLERSYKPYTTSEEFQTVAKFECRGIEVCEFLPSSGFQLKSVLSDKTWDDIDLHEGDWADYDEDGDGAVGIYEFKSQFVAGQKK